MWGKGRKGKGWGGTVAAGGRGPGGQRDGQTDSRTAHAAVVLPPADPGP